MSVNVGQTVIDTTEERIGEVKGQRKGTDKYKHAQKHEIKQCLGDNGDVWSYG